MPKGGGAISPSLLVAHADDESPPQADSDDSDSASGDEMFAPSEAGKDSIAGEVDGHDASDSEFLYRFIEKSVRYQDLMLAQKAAVERLEHFKGFAAQMSPRKQPVCVISNCQARVARANKRISTFRKKYAKSREQALARRESAKAQRANRTDEEKRLNRVVHTVIRKQDKMRKHAAARAAIVAAEALGSDASETQKLAVSTKAYTKAFLNVSDP